jgi:hypothetical protein
MNGATPLPCIKSYENYINAITVYDNKLYFIGAFNGDPKMGNFGVTIVNNSVKNIYPASDLPITNFANGADTADYYSIFVTATGGIIIGGTGRIISSF